MRSNNQDAILERNACLISRQRRWPSQPKTPTRVKDGYHHPTSLKTCVSGQRLALFAIQFSIIPFSGTSGSTLPSSPARARAPPPVSSSFTAQSSQLSPRVGECSPRERNNTGPRVKVILLPQPQTSFPCFLGAIKYSCHLSVLFSHVILHHEAHGRLAERQNTTSE